MYKKKKNRLKSRVVRYLHEIRDFVLGDPVIMDPSGPLSQAAVDPVPPNARR